MLSSKKKKTTMKYSQGMKRSMEKLGGEMGEKNASLKHSSPCSCTLFYIKDDFFISTDG